MPARKKPPIEEEPLTTETESAPTRKEDAFDISEGPPDTPFPITEMESARDSAEMDPPVKEDAPAEASFPITETEMSLDESEEAIEKPPDERFPITETESSQRNVELHENLQNSRITGSNPGDMQEASAPILITETENAAQPDLPEPSPTTETKTVRRRTRRTSTQTQSDEPEKEAHARTRTARTRDAPRIVSIDERRTVETEEDKARNDLIDLLESQKSGRILSGTIRGVENTTDRPPKSLAVIYHGSFKIIIPAEELVELPERQGGRPVEELLHYHATRRLGAEVDYIVKGIDAEAHIAAASRLEAMRAKRRQMFFGTDRDGNYVLREGVCAEARVVAVIRAGIFVDLCGLETYIPLRELSYQRMMDASTQYRPGQRILVKLLEVERIDRLTVRAVASVKQAGENPFEKAMQRYSVGNSYVGTVGLVDTTGVFVALDGGIDCLCSYPRFGRPPRGAQVTVRILGMDQRSNRIWGAITHIAAAR